MWEGYVIRQAKRHDLDEIANLEKLCFPEEEAASKAAFFERLSVYANHFWLLEKDGHIISMVNGMVTHDNDLDNKVSQASDNRKNSTENKGTHTNDLLK